ncbi:lactoylglutathione lyase [Streptosporangium becharense]|uniref:Lactoylglutathione lyase n=1 Tax=Streptosporangium becharense TaxID=1816182 RepID=A0A7W9MIV2_9ACTN|nr:VOC family protein [Streptosporangium becharense]MBB2911034.1 lactoylglutathione lyase [Streptosporangium becharense]MBB5821908.1 lactoylglutathione lyase [Streptosporangium becharense]
MERPGEHAAGRRAFPVVHTRHVSATARFYERLGFVPHTRHPATGEPGFVGLRRGANEIAVSGANPPPDPVVRPGGGGDRPDLAVHPGDGGARMEMFVFVDALDAVVERLRADGVPVLREPAVMPWGERVAYVADPGGNRVAVASPAGDRTPPSRPA